MAKRKGVATPKVVVDKNAVQFMRTAANLARKGKTNKKLRGRNANPKAMKYNISWCISEVSTPHFFMYQKSCQVNDNARGRGVKGM